MEKSQQWSANVYKSELKLCVNLWRGINCGKNTCPTLFPSNTFSCQKILEDVFGTSFIVAFCENLAAFKFFNDIKGRKSCKNGKLQTTFDFILYELAKTYLLLLLLFKCLVSRHSGEPRVEKF